MLKKENVITSLHIADIHWKAIPSTKLYNELKKSFIEYIKKNGDIIDIIFIHGDFYDSKVSLTEQASSYSIKFLYQFLILCKKLKIEVRMIKGTKTHDFNQLDNFKSYEKQFKFFKIINVVSEEDFNGCKILYVPEEYMNDQDKYYEEYKDKEYNYIIGHGTWDVFAFQNQVQESERPIKGSPVFKYKEWENTVNDNGLIIFGHIHVQNKYKKLHYIGSFSRWCYGEEKDKGFLVSKIYLDKTKKPTTKFIKNEYASEYKTVELSEIVDSNSNIEDKINEIDKLSNDENTNYRIKVDKDLSLDKLKVLRESFSETDNIKIELKLIKDTVDNKDNEEYDFLTNDADQNIKNYIKNKFGKDISIEEIIELTTSEE